VVLFTATGKLKKIFFGPLEIFDVWISYRCVSCHLSSTHRTSLVVKKKKKKLFQFSCGREQFH
jgi:hypothetical protein